MENDIIRMQEIISHQGDEIARLSAELYEQQKKVTELFGLLKKLEARASADSEQNIRPLDQEVPPPHY